MMIVLFIVRFLKQTELRSIYLQEVHNKTKIKYCYQRSSKTLKFLVLDPWSR